MQFIRYVLYVKEITDVVSSRWLQDCQSADRHTSRLAGRPLLNSPLYSEGAAV